MAQDHWDQALPGETASIAFGRTERLGLSDRAHPVQSARNNTPNMQRNMYTPSPVFSRDVHVTATIT